MEATLSRMKTIQIVLSCNSNRPISNEPDFRFVAVSATFPNVEDVMHFYQNINFFHLIMLLFLIFLKFLNNKIK